MFSMRVDGTAPLLKALDPNLMTKSLGKALRQASTLVMRAAKVNAGRASLKRRTGNLASSVAQDVDENELEAAIGSNLVYAPVHEYGATIKPLPPNKWLRFIWAPRGVTVTKGHMRNASLGLHWVSVKQVVIPARPWLGPAYTDNRDRILGLFQGSVQRSLTP